MPQVSVVIPSYNQPKTIQECVDSILTQSFTGGYEIIIVDSSSPEQQSELESFCQTNDKIRLIKLEKQTFPGAARNVGIKQAQSDIIALIDSDCIADYNWIERIYENMGDKIIISGVFENGTPNSIFGTCYYLLTINHFLPFRGNPKEIFAAATGNFSCKKKVFEQVGYFSDARAFEDFLFCRKFIELGGKVVQHGNIVVKHINYTSFSKIKKSEFMLGEFSAKGRKANKMSPKIVFKYPILSFGLIGFRYFSIFSRVIRSKHIFKFILYTPIIFYLLIQWGLGFYKGVKEA